jgi:7,8-dihydropterin-6-yl-methyl-4-(beta-D-ribofuranosyl)aminobenzene 5'-phosphate synthase
MILAIPLARRATRRPHEHPARLVREVAAATLRAGAVAVTQRWIAGLVLDQPSTAFFESASRMGARRATRSPRRSIMRTFRHVIETTFAVSLALLASCATTHPAPKPASAEPARITVLYDAFGANPAMTRDWGYAALVEINGKRILFDTGDDAAILARNAKAKGVDLSRLDFVVLSHRHSDHVSGLSAVLRANPHVVIYAPKEGFGMFGSDLPSTFYRKDDSLPAEKRYYGGTPPPTLKFGTVFPGADIRLVDKSIEVTPGITLIALVSDAPGTKELKELSLAIDTPDGVVLVVGCSHPGIGAIVAEASKIDAHIHVVAGGFHLVTAPDAVIAGVVGALRDTYKVDFVAPGHCTGEPTFAALEKAFGTRYLYAGVGTVLSLGASPRVISDRGGASRLDDGDLRNYRALLSRSDDPSEASARR